MCKCLLGQDYTWYMTKHVDVAATEVLLFTYVPAYICTAGGLKAQSIR